MEDIEKYFLKNEIVLWKYIETKNLLKYPLIKIGLGIGLALSLSINYNILFYTSFRKNLVLFFSLILFPIVVFVVFGVSLIIPGIRKYIEISNNLKTSAKNLWRYTEIFMITNKRIIHKSYNIFEIDYVKNPITNLEDLEINRDMVFVKLSSISVVSTEALKKFYQVAFKFSNRDENYIPLLFTVPFEKFPEFIDVLKDQIPLKRLEREGNLIVNYHQD